MISVHQDVRGRNRAAGIHCNAQRSIPCEVSTRSSPYGMERQVIARAHSIVGLVRSEVQVIPAVGRSVMECDVDRGLSTVLLIIDFRGARGTYDRLVVIAGVIPGNSPIKGRLAVLSGHRAGKRENQTQSKYGHQELCASH